MRARAWPLEQPPANAQGDLPVPLLPHVRPSPAATGLRALIYSGDHDMAVPHTGSEAWTHDLKLVGGAGRLPGELAGHKHVRAQLHLCNFCACISVLCDCGPPQCVRMPHPRPVAPLGPPTQEKKASWRPWYVRGSEDGTRQVAGYAVEYEGLTFATVKGAGHMVPQNKPVRGEQGARAGVGGRAENT